MEGGPYNDLEPAALWRHFAALNAIPRPSGRESEAREYVRGVAEAAGAAWEVDARGNAIARIAARDGCGGPTVAIQSHLDMVCESAPGIEHDCERDPIVPRREDDRIFASGTTLGADNGIGVAAALALLSDPAAEHGPLELLFTVEEETGLYGAAALDISILRAEALINLDSEDDKALTVGCAGGADVELTLPTPREPVPADWHTLELGVSGLAGGHSGMQIHERRANAILLLTSALDRLRQDRVEFRLASLQGGSAHNAIPREASARLALTDVASEQVLAAALAELRDEWSDYEPKMALDLSTGGEIDDVLSASQTEVLIDLLHELPHGALRLSERFTDTVETSANLAIVRTAPESIRIVSSARSLKEAALRQLQESIVAAATAAGARAKPSGGYPGWEPRGNSPLLAAARDAYVEALGREPSIEVVHGGLECGVIVAKKPELDAISFGPLIKDAHSPSEHVYAPTVADTYRLLLALLGKLARPTIG